MTGLLTLATLTAMSLESGSGFLSWLRQPVTPAASGRLAEVRMTPEVLAAAGFTQADATDLRTIVLESPQVLAGVEEAREALAEAENAARDLQWRVRTNPSNETLRAERASAEAAVRRARSNLRLAQEQAIETLCQSAPSGAAESITAALGQGGFEDAALLVGARSSEQSHQLRLAEIHASRCERTGQSPAAAASQVLGAARSSPGYAAARQGLTENLAAVTSVLANGR